jgi:tetratricopeptide (TPR) repeat protein
MAQLKKSIPPEKRIDARRDFTRRILPWLIVTAMLVFYLMTLNSWISLSSLGPVSTMCGWLWFPQLNTPLYEFATLPLRLLPMADIPIALNLFSAVCAALTLGLLARSVGLLPHDRTEAQLVRERNDFFLLTLRSAWFPVVLAVLLCGLQLTFWENATNGGNEMLDLLLFAFVIWSLLEYRLDEREGRLYLSSFIVGAMIAEGPAMTGFFPLYIVAIIWTRGLSFFNWRFLSRMTLCGLAGISLFLILPILALISGKASGVFLEVLKFSIEPQIRVLKTFFYCATSPTQYFDDVMMPLFISLMPLLVLSIRWKFGDSSRLGSFLASSAFHTIHAIFFWVCVWLAFDPPFSPREKNLGLTPYYLVALGAGYYAGYFLLVFGKKSPRGEEFPPFLVKLWNFLVVAVVWLLGILAIAGLFYKNAPLIRAANDSTLSDYSTLVARSLPHNGGIVLSDDPQLLYLTQAALVRDGDEKNYLMLNTLSLPYPQYHRYLHALAPQKWPLLVSATNNSVLSPLGLVHMLALLGRTNELCYLHPSFGYYFEEFYLEPHGLIYQLKVLPNSTLLPPAPDQKLIAENETFWDASQTGALRSIENEAAPPPANTPETLTQKILAGLHIPHEENLGADFAGRYCSLNLDFWGVELQQAGYLVPAATRFKMALWVNPDNIAAQTNLCINGDLKAGRPTAVDLSQVEQLGHTFIFNIIKEDGPFDGPSFCLEHGLILAQDNGFMRQSVAPFERVRQLDPGNWLARSWLAQIYELNRLPDRALEALRAPLNRPEDFSLSEDDFSGVSIMAAAAYFQKNDLTNGSRLLETQISRNPSNDELLVNAVRVYLYHGMYSEALVVANRKLSLSPDDPNWLLNKGYIDNKLKKYHDAIAVLNSVLAMQTNNLDALFQRANAYFNTSNFDAARADFEKLEPFKTNSISVAYGLGEIAWQQHNTNEAIRHFEIYLANASTNTAEAQTVIEQLHELKQPAGGK